MAYRLHQSKYFLSLMTRLGALLFAIGQLAPLSIWCMEADGRVVLESGRGGCLTEISPEPIAMPAPAGGELSEQCSNGHCKDVTTRQALTKCSDARFAAGAALQVSRFSADAAALLDRTRARLISEPLPAPNSATRCHRLRRIQV